MRERGRERGGEREREGEGEREGGREGGGGEGLTDLTLLHNDEHFGTNAYRATCLSFIQITTLICRVTMNSNRNEKKGKKRKTHKRTHTQTTHIR